MNTARLIFEKEADRMYRFETIPYEAGTSEKLNRYLIYSSKDEMYFK